MLERLNKRAAEDEEVSLVLCTNMLSVGVDVQRLGIELVNGQPKSTSEYIQATSRVGRGKVPGLILCVYSPTKPRDRSHYERFLAYHSALYRHVEPTSVTPFAQPARDRALHAVLVSLVRHKLGLSDEADAHQFTSNLPDINRITDFIMNRLKLVDEREAQATARQIERLFDEWETRTVNLEALEYYSSHRSKEVLLCNVGDTRPDSWETLQSMRNVDHSCIVKVIGV
jgi:hypothetical protein